MLPPPSQNAASDDLIWGPNPVGTFSSQSAYSAIHHPVAVPHHELFACVWKWRGPERGRLLLWKAMHGKLMTNLERSRRHLASSSTYPLCNTHEESLLHCFRDCHRSATLWLELLQHSQQIPQNAFFANSDWFMWLADNIKGRISGITLENWSLHFGLALDVLWQARNQLIFDNKETPVHVMVRRIRGSVSTVLDAAHRAHTLLCSWPSPLSPKPLVWQRPPPDCFSLCCDASISDSGALACGGGLLRDAFGTMKWGFHIKFAVRSIVEAELQAICTGLECAHRKGVEKVVVESDNEMAINLLLNGFHFPPELTTVLHDILDLVPSFASVTWKHIFREANGAAHELCRRSRSDPKNFDVIEGEPSFIVPFLEMDLGTNPTR